MCGRTCLTLEPREIQCACKYRISKKPCGDANTVNPKDDGSVIKEEYQSEKKEAQEAMDSKYIMPEWRDEYNLGRKYMPSYNLAPTDISPVLISADHFCDGRSNSEIVLVPMYWSMIPFWHKGDYRKHGLTTNNCRLEQLETSKLYSGPLRRGQRCVVLCEGMYEWQTTMPKPSKDRAAYYIFAPQKSDVKIYDKSSWSPGTVNLLKMAGLFDIWEDENGDKIYSYTIITYESSSLLSWLHHRMPAVLETEDQVKDWLDYKRVPYKKALDLFKKPPTKLQWHRVGNIVNNSRNKSENCNKPIELAKKSIALTSENKGLLTWLNVRKRPAEGGVKSIPSSHDEQNTLDVKSEDDISKGNAPKRLRGEVPYESTIPTDGFSRALSDSEPQIIDETTSKPLSQ